MKLDIQSDGYSGSWDNLIEVQKSNASYGEEVFTIKASQRLKNAVMQIDMLTQKDMERTSKELEEQRIRDNSPAVAEAYKNYHLLLILAKENIYPPLP